MIKIKIKVTFYLLQLKKQLDFLEFPLGSYTKDETRKLAKKYNLNTSDKPESQDICFVPNGNYSEIIKKLKPESYVEGEIVDLSGNKLGMHNGIINFTIGQRKGIGISSDKPLYVIKIDPTTNKVIVGEKEDLKSTKLKIKELNWLSTDEALEKDVPCSVRLRSNHKEINANVRYLGDGTADVILESSYYGITPGQACVMYDKDRVLGGGWIIKEE